MKKKKWKEREKMNEKQTNKKNVTMKLMFSIVLIYHIHINYLLLIKKFHRNYINRYNWKENFFR